MKFLKILTFIIPILCLLIGIGMLGYPYYEEWKNNKKTEALIQEFITNPVKENHPEDTNTEQTHVNNQKEDLFSENKEDKVTVSHESTKQKTWGIIIIPDINVKAPIMEGTSDWILNQAAGIYKTSDKEFAELDSNIGIAAHSTRYKGKCWYCYFDYIGNLKNGNKVQILKSDGKIYNFEVIDVKVNQKTDADYAYRTNPNEARMTLVTCTDGDGKYRTFVTTKLISVE